MISSQLSFKMEKDAGIMCYFLEELCQHIAGNSNLTMEGSEC